MLSEGKTYRVVAITGGIGCGKSVVSEILRTIGYEVYDCDTMAKRIMDSSSEIKCALMSCFGDDVIDDDGIINRKLLSSIVFGDEDKLLKLNVIVHDAVCRDLQDRIALLKDTDNYSVAEREKQQLSILYPYFFFETAILYQSGLDRIADQVWRVDAPHELRVKRVMKRNGMAANDVESRIATQQNEHTTSSEHIIINDDKTPLIPQVIALLQLPYGK